LKALVTGAAGFIGGYLVSELLEAGYDVVGVDNSGLSGLELQQNRDLAGQPGSLVAERDSGGDAISLGASHLAS